MNIIDRGSGTPVVLVPGIQGRWEWMKPAVDALAARCRVITFSLADEPTCGAPFDDRSGFDCYVRQIGDALDALGLESAIVCGISYRRADRCHVCGTASRAHARRGRRLGYSTIVEA